MRSPSKLLASLVLLVLVVTACSDDTEITIEEAKEQFCSDVSDYIESIGEYGGLFQDVELTVGDVRSAADELAPGRDAVVASAETFKEAVAADAVEGVEIEIVDPESIETVKEAEDAFARASDIDDRTPLVEAGVGFVSAAYQLEVAWVRLFVDAGCLEGDEERQAEAQQWVSDYVAAIQTDFAAMGYYTGEIDGIFGPETIAAIEQFQTDQGLPVTGLVDPATQAAVQRVLGQRESAQVGALQAILTATGHYTGPVDGVWTPSVEAALIALQRDLGVPATGVIDAATLRALEDALAAAGEEPTPPSTEAPAPTEPPPVVTTTTAPQVTTTAAPTPTTTVPVTAGILEVLAEAGRFQTFLAAVETAGLTETLSGPGPFTIFAPDDDAFAAAGDIPTDPEALEQLILYHVVADELIAFELAGLESVTTLQGGTITVAVEGGAIVLNGVATATITNVDGSNGVAHVVNTVLTPTG